MSQQMAPPTGRLSPSGNGSAAKEIDNAINDAGERVRLQHCQFARDEVGARGEELAWPGVAGDAQRAGHKWKSDENDSAYCRYAHASSSSGRFQSSASAVSLRSAVSETLFAGLSSKIVTSARHAVRGWIGSRSLTFPCSSMTASTVLIIDWPLRTAAATLVRVALRCGLGQVRSSTGGCSVRSTRSSIRRLDSRSTFAGRLPCIHLHRDADRIGRRRCHRRGRSVNGIGTLCRESSPFDFLRPTMASSSFSRDYPEPVEESRNVARI